MPYRRRRTSRRRNTRSTLRKRYARMRRARAMRKRKSYARRRRLTRRVAPHFKTNGFPANKVVTLKYVDNVIDITPKSIVEGAMVPTGENGPATARFSANHVGRPDAGPTVVPEDSSVKEGEHPHQPMGYDQYTMLYERATVLSSKAVFDVTFSSARGTDVESGRLDYNNTSILPAGVYVGVMKYWNRDPIELPKHYAEYLERYKRPLKFVPFKTTGSGTCRLVASYVKPSVNAVQRRLDFGSQVYENPQSRVSDPFTIRNGDLTTATGTEPEREMQLTAPVAEMFYKLVVYYPDNKGKYVQGSTLSAEEVRASIGLRCTARIWYRTLFMRKRQLQTSSLYVTPGMNYQDVAHTGGEGEGFDSTGDGLPDPGDAPAVKRARLDNGVPDGDGDGTMEGAPMGGADDDI
jgi:hypothetical protein